MSFIYSKYITLVIIAIIVIVIVQRRTEKNFFVWVYDNWFYKRSIANKLSSLAFLVGFSLLSFSLLDLRGAEQKVEGEVSDKRTIILIDSSLSMLAEDVRPNRYDKAVFIARHFIKNSAGHKISVILFSDTHKKLVPFTMDRELLDSRVAALSDIGVSGGGTGLKQAIQESIQYFGTGEKKGAGNIILITDAEETNGGFKLNVPENITVAVVGVGTANGSTIPLRDSRGVSRGFKKYQGQNVVSKLDEDFLKKIGEDIKYYKYWVASSFSLPTNEILNFFNQSVEDRKSKDDVTIRPVYSEVLMIPGVLFLILSFILKFFKAFDTSLAMILLLMILLPKGFSQEEQEERQLTPEEIERQKEIDNYLLKWQNKELNDEEKLDLATKYSQNKNDEKADLLYEDTLIDSEVTPKTKYDHFNWATTKLRQKDFSSSLDKLKKIKNFLEQNPSEENRELLEAVRKNTLLAIQQKQQSDKKKKQQSGQGESKDKKQKSSGSEDDKQKNKDPKDNKGDKDEGQNQEKNKDQKNNQGDQDKNQKKRKRKLPGLLKQLLNDDRKLQKQLLDTSTNKKDNSSQRRDW